MKPLYKFNFEFMDMLRVESGMTIDDLAAALNVNASQVWRWSKGATPRKNTVKAMLALFRKKRSLTTGNFFGPMRIEHFYTAKDPLPRPEGEEQSAEAEPAERGEGQ